ncbi:MAG TPA: 3-hydroxyacyl-CoA dehydrogenase family protein [Rubrobacter sp.]|nr:3-hydroxyacyl-CoA dehydrogenase family protein [Rubrobacter sp.]
MHTEAARAEWPTTAAILGAGTMGLGVAECFAAAGMTVRLTDATPELAREAKEKLVLRAQGHAEAGLLPEEAVGRAEGVEVAGGAAEAVAGADLVFEAVPESVGLKEEVLGACSAGASAEAVIVSNTSSLPMDDLARFVEGPGRFCGMHWFNPPEWTPGVEVIPAATTDARTVGRLVGFLRSIGKRPAVVGSGPGFVANRIQNALFLEAVRCVEDGLASPEEVDEVVRSCFGFRLPFFGPFAIADMAGLDVYASVLGVLEDGIGERFGPPRMLLDLVEGGRTGTKAGAGFLDYTDEERERLLLERDRRYAALLDLLDRLPPVEAGREEA